MAKSILLKNIHKYVGKQVSLKGWLYNIRSSGKIAFLQFRDGTSTIQAVALKNTLDDKSWSNIESLSLESSLIISGGVKQDDRAPTGYEIELDHVKIIQLAPDDYPIGKKEHGAGFLLENRHLWLRSPKQRAIQIIRNQVVKSLHRFYFDHDFVEIDTPIFTPTACEGTTTLFEVDYFGEPAYLSQSGQLYLEACLPGFNRVFDFQPVFRAEKSKTRKHLTEFWMTNAEAAFIDHQQSLDIQEKLITYVIKQVIKHCQPELEILNRDLDQLAQITSPFDRISHQEAVDYLRKKGSSITYNDDLGAEDEVLLTQGKDKPTFVEYFPAHIKAFYMKRLESDNTKAKCADLIATQGHGEIIGGSQREDDYQTLLESIKSHNLPVKDFQWYLDQRRYGSVPHSGFGVGLERLVKWICDLKHVRTTIPFPRMINRLRP
jgi:asparaginyl-tRNA synthetase